MATYPEDDTGDVGAESAGSILSASTPVTDFIGRPIFAALNADRRQKILNQVLSGYRDIQQPTFGGQYQMMPYAGDYAPSDYATPESAQYQQIQIDPRLREYQMQALGQIRDLGEGAAFAKSETDRRQAQMEANQLAQAREAAVMQNAQARGVGGSGLEMAMRGQAGQDASNRAMMGGLNAASQAAIQRLAANQAYSSGLGSVRGQDTSLAASNADIINRFNMYNTSMRNQIAQANIAAHNAAQARNLQARQGVAGANAGIYNQGVNRSDQNSMRAFEAAMARQRNIAAAQGEKVAESRYQTGENERQGEKEKQDVQEMMSMGMGAAGGAGGIAGGQGGMGGIGSMMGGGGGNVDYGALASMGSSKGDYNDPYGYYG